MAARARILARVRAAAQLTAARCPDNIDQTVIYLLLGGLVNH
jgi:hypothetical protein